MNKEEEKKQILGNKEDTSKKEEEWDKKEEKKEEEVQEIVLKVDMHCEACARKVTRALKGFQGSIHCIIYFSPFHPSLVSRICIILNLVYRGSTNFSCLPKLETSKFNFFETLVK